MNKSRAVRVWLVVLSVVAVTIVAGCGGAGAAAVRALGRVGGRAAPVVKPVVYTPPKLPALSPPAPLTGAPFRVGSKVDHGVGAGREGAMWHGHVPVDSLYNTPDRDERRKK